MQQFLPYLKSKELEKQFRYEQNNSNRKYFIMLCIIEIVNFSYGFGKIIQDGIINSKLISSYVTILLAYAVILLFNIRQFDIGLQLMPFIQCFFPAIRWINDLKSLSMNQTSEYIQGVLNIVQLTLHIQSPNYFYKIFCLTCYVVSDAVFNLEAENDRASYAAIIITFLIFFLKQFKDDQRLRYLFLQYQSLYMWQQLIDTQLKMNFFVAKPKKVKKKNDKNQQYQNQIQMHFVNKQALQTFSCNTTEKFNAFLERIIIQEEDDEMGEDGFRSRFLSEKMSSNRLLSISKRSTNKTLISVCQQIIEQNQKQNYTQTLSTIAACQEYTGIIQSQRFASTQSKKFDEGDISDQQESSKSKMKDFKPQQVQIKLYYYNLTEEYLIIQIEEEDYKLKAKKQKEEQKKALAFRDHLTYRMKQHIENIIYEVKVNFEQFKQLPNYKAIMFDFYLLKQYQQNIITTFTDFNINMPFEVCQVNLKLLVISLLNLFSDDIKNNKLSYPSEIFSFELKDEEISTSSNWLNHILFNLMLNGKQHGQRNSEIQIKISPDQLDDNLINIEVVNELQTKNQEQQLINIEDLMKLQTQEDLFSFYYQRQKMLDNMIQLKQLRNEIRSKQGDTPDYRSKQIINDTLKYTLGIFVSRQSLKKIGPSGQICYTLTKVKDKQYLIASFQIYKDMELIYKKEKDTFVQLFGKSTVMINNNYIQQINNNNNNNNNGYNIYQQLSTANNINNPKSNKREALSLNNPDEQQYPQQEIKDFLLSKAMSLFKNQGNQLNLDEGTNLQNYKNQIINAQLQQQTDSVISANKLYQNQSLISNSNQNSQLAGKSSNTQNIFNHQKSQFYRDTVTDELRNMEESNEDSLKITQNLDSAKRLRKKSSLISDQIEIITDNDESDTAKNNQIQQLQDYQLNFKRNPGQVESLIDGQIDQGLLNSKYISLLTTQRDNLISKEEIKVKNGDQCQTEDQNTFSTPNMYGQAGFLLNSGDTPLLHRKIIDS